MQWRDTSKQRKAGQGKSNAWEDQASTSKAKAAAFLFCCFLDLGVGVSAACLSGLAVGDPASPRGLLGTIAEALDEVQQTQFVWESAICIQGCPHMEYFAILVFFSRCLIKAPALTT